MKTRGSVIAILVAAVLAVGVPAALAHQASPKPKPLSACTEAQWRAGAQVREGKVTLTCSLKKVPRHHYFWDPIS